MSARYRTNGSNDHIKDQNAYIITKFNLPEVSEMNDVVVLTPDDILDQFTTVYDVDVTQGGTFHQDLIFYTYGFGSPTRPSAIRVFDVKRQEIISTIDLSESIASTHELESCAIWEKDDGSMSLIVVTATRKIYIFDLIETKWITIKEPGVENGEEVIYNAITGEPIRYRAIPAADLPVLDKSVLTTIINEAEGLEKDRYTQESWEKLESALSSALAINENPDASQSEVDEEVDGLQQAIEGLVLKEDPIVKVDKEALSTKIEEAKGLEKDRYTQESWEELESALSSAIALNDNPDVNQSEIDQGIEILQKAIDGLMLCDNFDKETSIDNVSNPKTGDNSIGIYLLLLPLSLASSLAIYLMKNRKLTKCYK